MKSLSRNFNENDALILAKGLEILKHNAAKAGDLKTQSDIDSMLHVSLLANKSVYDIAEKEINMCETFLKFLKIK